MFSMLAADFRYVSIDFETTGLDVHKDEPIQVGIVEMDHTGKIISEYQSLIKPKKDINELKSIVGFITGLDITDLADAPSMEDVLSQITPFFDEKTIVIGHNISFDMKFLQRYASGTPYHAMIDTFTLARALIHFVPSYAQEVLAEQLQKDTQFVEFHDAMHITSDEIAHHDALYDTKTSLALFQYCICRMHALLQIYPQLAYVLRQSDSVLRSMIPVQTSAGQKLVTLPLLQPKSSGKVSLSSTKDSLDFSRYLPNQRWYIGDIPMADVLQRIVSNKKVILSFSHRQKLEIAKNILASKGVTDIGYATQSVMISKDTLLAFLNKGHFSEDELLFVFKYASHVKDGYTVFDQQTTADRQIYHFLKETKEMTSSPMILTTHGGLYHMFDTQPERVQDYTVCYFDTEWRYKSYNIFHARPFDPYYLLSVIEGLQYVYQLRAETEQQDYTDIRTVLDEFYRLVQTRIGTLFMETKQLFIDVQEPTIPVDPIVNHSKFHKTNTLREKFVTHAKRLHTGLQPAEWQSLHQQLHKFSILRETLIKVTKKMYAQADFYFTYQEANTYINRTEFTDIFGQRKTLFLTHHDTQAKPLLENIASKKHTVRSLQRIDSPQKVITTIGELLAAGSKTIYVLSTVKAQSKGLFDACCVAGLPNKATLLVENITGGMGKNVFKAKQADNAIIIGGHMFLLELFSKQLHIDNTIVFNIKGPQEGLLLDDIRWYGNTRTDT